MYSGLKRRIVRFVSKRQWLIVSVATGLLGVGGTALWNRAADSFSTGMSTAKGLDMFVIASCMTVLGTCIYIVRRVEDIHARQRLNIGTSR